MKLLIAFSMIVSSTAFADLPPVKKFKTMNEVIASSAFVLNCTGKVGKNQVILGFEINRSGMSPAQPIQRGGIAIFTPGEGLYVHEWMNQEGFILQMTDPDAFWITGQSTYSHSDHVTLGVKNSTNGKFKGVLSYDDMVGTKFEKIDVACTFTNYRSPVSQP